MPLQLDDLNLLDAPQHSGGAPLMLPIESIDEDPEQPRKEFDDQTLRELAATIAQRGVRQPISVRRHPRIEGRWILNFGARRLRASRVAGKTDIPAFVDEAADSYDQMIENEQREPLKPLELALFVRSRIAAGDNQADIARRLGKSRQYITYATALIDPPDWLLEVYRDGQCRGLTELYELRRLHAQQPSRVEAWVSKRSAITREEIAELRGEMHGAGSQDARLSGPSVRSENADVSLSPLPEVIKRQPPTSARRTLALQVELDGAEFELIVDDAPSDNGRVFVRPVNGGPRRVVLASRLKLLGFASQSA